MKAARTHLLLLVLLLLARAGFVMAEPGVVMAPATGDSSSVPGRKLLPVPTESRRLALESLGAFTKDGFRIHDGEWSSSLAKGSPLFLQLALFAGNRYWFLAASPTAGAKLRIILYDAQGHPVKGEPWNDGGTHESARAAAGIVPETSGKYFVGVELLESSSNQPVDFCLVSAYK